MRVNPIWARELRERWRTPRARLLFVLFLTVIAVVALVSDGVLTGRDDLDRRGAAFAGVEGFRNTIVVLMAFVCVVAPAVAAASISSERERQTLRLVHITLLRPHEILLGKLAASLSFLLLLIVCTVPIASLSLVLGGVTFGEMARAYLMVAAVGTCLAFVGAALSAWTKRSLTSVGIAYLVVALLVGGTGVWFIQVRDAQMRAWEAEVRMFPDQQDPRRQKAEDLRPRKPTWTVVVNPMVALASAIQGDVPDEMDTWGYRQGFSSGSEGPTDGLFRLVSNEAAHLYAFTTFAPPGRTPTEEQVRAVLGPKGDLRIANHEVILQRHTPIWRWSIAWYLIVSALASAVGTIGLRRAR